MEEEIYLLLLLVVLGLLGTITQERIDLSNVVEVRLWVAVHDGPGVDLSIRLPINGKPDRLGGDLFTPYMACICVLDHAVRGENKDRLRKSWKHAWKLLNA